MRRIGRLLTAPALAALALLILPAPAARAQATPYSAEPRTAAAAPGAAKATVTGLTVGRHPGFDRVVLTFEGAVPGWSVRYADSITEDGSDAPVRLDGDATLELAVSPAGAARPDGGPALTATRRRPGFPALKEVRLAGDLEGRGSFGAGVAGRRPFRVLELTGPSRLVLDTAHDARAGTPARLAVTPGSGPSGTTLTVSGTGCNLPGEPVLLVLRGGEDAT